MKETSIDTVLTGANVGPVLFPDIPQMADGFLDQLPVGIATFDHDGVLTRYNRQAAELWGRAPDLHAERVRYCGAVKHYAPDGSAIGPRDLPVAEVIRTKARLRDKELVLERPDGTRIWVIVNADPLRGEDGHFSGVVCCLTDSTWLKLRHREESAREVPGALQAAPYDIDERERGEEQKALVNVLNHRVKNMLATVQALASQTIRGRGIKREVRMKFVARLFALSRAHDLLARESWLSADLQRIVREMLAPYHGRVEIAGKTLRISAKAALTLSMVLHELAANAARHGALSVPTGKVTLSWTVDGPKGDEILVLTWTETNGPPVTEPTRRGFGLRLVERSIVQELSGVADIAFEPTGVRCRLSFPIAGGVEGPGVGDQQPVPNF